MKNYYHILQIEYTANATQIKKAYRTLAKIYHPDTNTNLTSKQKFQEINDAYHTLIDIEKKMLYDVQLRNYYQNLANAATKTYTTQQKNNVKYNYTKKPTNETFADKYTYRIVAVIFILISSFSFLVSFLANKNRIDENYMGIKNTKNKIINPYTLIKRDKNGKEFEVELTKRSQFILDSIMQNKEKKNIPISREEIKIIQNLK